MIVTLVICGLPRSFQENAASVCCWVGAQEALGHVVRLVICVWNIMGTYTLSQGKKDYAKGDAYIDKAPLNDQVLRESYAGCDADICILDQDAMKPRFKEGALKWEEWGITNRRGKAYRGRRSLNAASADTDYIVIRPDRDVSPLPHIDRLVDMTKGNAIALSRFRNIGSDQWFAGDAVVMRRSFASCFDLLFDRAFVESVMRQVEKPEMILIESVTTHMCNMCCARLEFSEGPLCSFNDIVTAKSNAERQAKAQAKTKKKERQAQARADQEKLRKARQAVDVKRQERRPTSLPATATRAHRSFVRVVHRSKHSTSQRCTK